MLTNSNAKLAFSEKNPKIRVFSPKFAQKLFFEKDSNEHVLFPMDYIFDAIWLSILATHVKACQISSKNTPIDYILKAFKA